MNENFDVLPINSLIINSQKIRFEKNYFFFKEFKSIMLEDLSSSQLSYKSDKKYFYLAIIFPIILISLAYISNNFDFQEYSFNLFIAGIISFIVFIIFYLFSLRKTLIFASSSMKIEVSVRFVSYEKIKATINAVEIIKNQRIMEINKK